MTETPSSPFDPFHQAKAEARAHAAMVRRMAHADYGAVAAEKLVMHLSALSIVPNLAVAGYWPMGDEIDPRPLMEALAGRGCLMALPVVTARHRPLAFRAWVEGDALERGPHGTRHPADTMPLIRPDIVLVPLLAFDLGGGRLGYGGGYYDRTLATLRNHHHVTAIGLAFAAQRMERVPRGAHDEILDLILTEQGPLKPESA